MRAISVIFFLIITFIITSVLAVVAFVGRIFSLIFGTSYKPKQTYGHKATEDTTKQSQNNGQNKKIFDKSDGEYVDFEEIKD